MLDRSARLAVVHRALLALVAAAAPSACTSESVSDERVVVLPPESERWERFIERPTFLTADVVTVQAVTAYRRDMAPAVDPQRHRRSITPSRIELVNEDEMGLGNPVRLSFRNFQISGRKRIEVVFSDVPLEKPSPSPAVLLVVGEGVAHLRGEGVDLIGDRIVVRNDEAKAFDAAGRPMPQAP